MEKNRVLNSSCKRKMCNHRRKSVNVCASLFLLVISKKDTSETVDFVACFLRVIRYYFL